MPLLDILQIVGSEQTRFRFPVSSFLNAKLLPLFVLSSGCLRVASKASSLYLAPDFNHKLYHEICNIVALVKTALIANSYAIIVAHNHPGGSLKPSSEDLETTEQLIKAGKLLGVSVLDHVIVASSGFISLRQEHPDLWFQS